MNALLKQLDAAHTDRPIRLGRYEVIGRLGQGGMGTVYDAFDRERGSRVAIKVLQGFDPRAPSRFKSEFRSLCGVRHENLVAMHELDHRDGAYFLVMEHVDGEDFVPWARYMESSPEQASYVEAPAESAVRSTELLDQPESLKSGPKIIMADEYGQEAAKRASAPPSFERLRDGLAQLVRGVREIHSQGLLHLDLKSSNVKVTPDGRVVVLDFGLIRSLADGTDTTNVAGTPPYMAPEQLMGERLSEATDWYAVGCMLYLALTGRLPFRSANSVALYVSKTLKTPKAPVALVPEVPLELSDITMALLHPDADKRPSGADLAALLGDGDAPAYRTAGRVAVPFVGRAEELSRLDAILKASLDEPTAAVLQIAGPSGIGKSSLMREVVRTAKAKHDAWVLHGRCYERERLPYNGFDGIVDRLAMHLRSAPQDTVRPLLPRWSAELAQAFPVLNSVKSIAALGYHWHQRLEPHELRRRSRVALRELLAALSADTPLVLQIDDVQWADADTIALLETLLTPPGLPRTLIMTSYRPDEAEANEVVQGWLDKTENAERLTLGPLGRDDAVELARSALTALGAQEEAAASVAAEATGVPFFVEELTRFVSTHPGASTSLSLDEMLLERVAQLEDDAGRMLRVVAVAGGPVEQAVVFDVAGLEAADLPILWELRSENLLRATGVAPDDLVEIYHDRLRECVTASLPAEQRTGLHLRLADALLERNEEDGPWLFDVVRHYEAGGSLTPERRRAAVELALRAGRRAQAGAAFPLGFRCFEAGLAWLGQDADEDVWESHYELAHGLTEGSAMTAYLTANTDVLAQRIDELKDRSRDLLDQRVAWELEINAATGRGDYRAALASAHAAAALLGVPLPAEVGEAEIEAALGETLEALGELGPEGLEALPNADDPRAEAGMRVLVKIAPLAFFAAPPLVPIIACKLIGMSLQHGLTPTTSYALGLMGIVLNTAGMHDVSHAWGQVALRLLDRWEEDRRLEAATRQVVQNLVCTYAVPLDSTLDDGRTVFEIGKETGDFEFAAYAGHVYTFHALYCGARPLGALLEDALSLGEQMRAMGDVNALHVHVPFEQTLKCLCGAKENVACLDDDAFSEEEALALVDRVGSRSGAMVLHTTRGLVRLHLGDPLEAMRCFDSAREFFDAVASLWHIPVVHQYGALAACFAWDRLAEEERAARRGAIGESLDALRGFCVHGADNFHHKVRLLEGALHLIDGDDDAALEKLAEAAAEAAERGWHNDAALAHELSARAKEPPDGALERARDAYAAWGATAKVAQLDG